MHTGIKNFLSLKSPIIIDGGLSNVLESKGCNLNHSLWTAKLLSENPEILINSHIDYIDAGAQVLATASYQASFPGLINEGYTKEDARHLMIKSVSLVEEAIRKAKVNRHIYIAASLGPYGAYLADGSEYRGDYGISKSDLIEFHGRRIEVFENSNADILAFETIPSLLEAEAIAELLQSTKKPAWVSFSCQNESLINDGAGIESAASLFLQHPKVFAIGVNCTHPKYILGLIKKLKKSTNKKVLVYPNSGEVYNPQSKSWLALSEPLAFAELTIEWIKAGADLVGGCCRIGPEHIQKVSQMINHPRLS